jgi:hypothetical protein
MKKIKTLLGSLLFTALLSTYNLAVAETNDAHADHQGHEQANDDDEFHGVYYGFIPCDNCPGLKSTLSLNKNDNYLLVTQQAKESSRENYEKGKYTWDDEKKLVVLTPRKGSKDSEIKQYQIEKNALILLDNKGHRFAGKDADRYILNRSDTVKTREIHFH